MPEYLAPGVFVEEVSFRSKSIEGVSTTTTGFIGPTRYGSVTEEPDVLTSMTEFERAYGDGQPLSFGLENPVIMQNYVWHAANAFFGNGGKRLYVTRVFRPENGQYPTDIDPILEDPNQFGHAELKVGDDSADPAFRVIARSPGVAGNFKVRFTLKVGPNVLGALPNPDGSGTLIPTVSNLNQGDVVWLDSAVAFPNVGSPVSSPPAAKSVNDLPIYVARRGNDGDWRFEGANIHHHSPPTGGWSLEDFELSSQPDSGDAIRPLSLAIEVVTADGTSVGTFTDLSLDPEHTTNGLPDSIFHRFAAKNPTLAGAPIILINGVVDKGNQLIEALDSLPDFAFELTQAEWNAAGNHFEYSALRRKLERGISAAAWLEGGNDGLPPGLTEYAGKADLDDPARTGLKQFEDIEDISIVAAPGSTWNYTDDRIDSVNSVINLMMTHASQMKYRIAVIDPPEAMTIAQVRKLRAKLDNKYAALYYPWVNVVDPFSRRTIALPPSGFVAGIYARNDIERAVWKAPANEVVNGAIDFETLINTAQQEVLNPEGINCFRFFEGRGYRLWGARTLSSDPEWKYVNLRRYFAYLERSIDKGTQWAVFEPNGEALWANVRATVRDFLANEWASGALLGDKPEKAFFVRCDRSTMTQNDLDNGRLVCLIGIAPLKPAEFVIFRIGQWTADRQS